MTHPIFICNGVFRSGSTWSFNVCRKLAMEVGAFNGQPFASAFMDHFALDEFFRVATNPVQGLTVIKAHFVGPLAMQWLRLSKVRAVCTYRDPRDCVASDRTFLGWEIERSINRVRSNYQALDEYRGCASILMIRYEEMMRDTLTQIRRIAGHFGIDLPEATLRRIDAEANVHSSRKICDELKHRSADEVAHVADHLVDPQTQLHNNHIFNSRIGRWRTELSQQQGRELTRIFHPWLVKFGYDIEVPRPTYIRELNVELGNEQAAVPISSNRALATPSPSH